MATKPKVEKVEQRIVAGAAMMTGAGRAGEEANFDRARQLEQRMHNARNKALEAGLTPEERSAAIDRAILRFQAGEPEE